MSQTEILKKNYEPNRDIVTVIMGTLMLVGEM